MSGIYIKSMEMPKHCWQCKFHDDIDNCIIIGENCVEVWGEYRRLDSCPLIPVPDHGRLIDADVLIGKLHDECLFDYDARSVVYADIQDAPTVIPASGGNENE